MLSYHVIGHNPYFNRWFSAMGLFGNIFSVKGLVTILILIDGFLQYTDELSINKERFSHNPYFNRWFSAIK